MVSIWQDLYRVFQPKPLQFCLPTNRLTYDTKKSTTPERHAEKQAQGTCGTQRFATLIWGWTLRPKIAEQVNAIGSNKGRIYAAIEIGNKTFEMQMDTGVSCNWANHWYIAKTVNALILLPGEYHTWGCNILKGNQWQRISEYDYLNRKRTLGNTC